MIYAKQGVYHRHFESVAEFMAYADQQPKRAENKRKYRQVLADNGGGSAWYGVATVDEVQRNVAEGWKEGADTIEELYAKMAAQLPRAIDVRRKRIRGDQGEELDIHAVYRGDLSRAWSQMTRAMRHGTSIVRVIADVCDNGGVRSDQLRWRGVAALAMSRILTRAGYSVELCAAIAGVNEAIQVSDNSMTTIVVKPRHVVQDTRLLAGTLALTGFFRYYGFKAIINRCDQRDMDVEGGLGQAANADSLIAPDSRVLQTVTPPLKNREAVEKWIKDTVKLFQKSTLQAESGR